MNNNPLPKYSWKARIKSFFYAFQGIFYYLKNEVNAQIHAIATIIVVTIGLCVGIDRTEWMMLILTIGMVWTLEIINSSIEKLADALHPNYHILIKRAKDMASGAVLIGAIVAIIIGLFIFLPYLLP